MFDIQAYLNLPDNPRDCIYEDYRNKILLNPQIFTHLLKYNNIENMNNINALNIALYNKYGECWIDVICFNNEELRNAIKLIYINDFPGKELILLKQEERRNLIKGI